MWTAAISALLLAAAPQLGVDGRALRAALTSSERSIDDRVQQLTSRAPFVLLGRTRGAYLAGYGAVFSLEVNLVPTANISPFRPAYTKQEIQNLNRQKRDKLADLRSGVRRLLAEQAASLAHVQPAEKIAIVVTLFHFNWEDTAGVPSQLVLQGQKQALLEAARSGPQELERVIEAKEF